jgi:hypothetical protein
MQLGWVGEKMKEMKLVKAWFGQPTSPYLCTYPPQYMEYEFHNYCWWQNFMFEINFGGFLKIERVVVWGNLGVVKFLSFQQAI